MRETDLLRRAAELLRKNVWTHEQRSEDEAGGYCSDEDAEMDGVALSLLALADEMERAEPVAVVGGQRRGWYYLSGHPSVSMGTKLYTHPAPEVTRDAERYRWLRDHACYRYSDGNDGPVLVCRDDDEDAAIDTAMQEPKP